MSVKFRVGLTIDGETLFALMAKMLPIEDLSVKELPPEPTLTERAFAVNKITRHAITASKRSRRSASVRLDKGINKVLVDALTERPMRALELQPLVKEAGWSGNSVNSRLESLRLKGFVTRISEGRWQLVKA